MDDASREEGHDGDPLAEAPAPLSDAAPVALLDRSTVAAASAPTDGSLTSPPPWRSLAEHPRYRYVVLAAVLSGTFASGLTLTALTAAVPFIAADLSATAAAVAWIVAAPFLFRAVFVPTFGKLGDRWGRRRLWLVGFGISTFASLACGFAGDVGWLIGLRALAAIASAAVVPTSLALLAAVFPPAERVKAMGYWTATIAAAPLLGVVVGGFVVEAFSWRWLFFGQFPFGLLSLVVGALVIGESRAAQVQRFDLAGATLSVLGLSALMLALNQGAEWGWSSPAVLGAVAVAIVALPAFLLAERRATAPILPLGYFRRRRFAAALTAKFFAHFAYVGAFFLIALFLADVLGYGPAEVALGVAPRAASLAVMGPLAGAMATRVGTRPTAVSGMVLIVVSTALLGTLGPGSSYLAVLPGLVLAGFGLGLVAPAAAAVATNEVARDDLGVAGGAINLAATVGASLGIAAMVAVTHAVAGGARAIPPHAYQVAFWAGAGVCLVGLVAAWFTHDRGGRRG